LWWFWLKRGAFAEGQQWLERAFKADADPSATLRAKALLALANMTFFQGDFVRTRALLGSAPCRSQNSRTSQRWFRLERFDPRGGRGRPL
jgi:hypothetical protein